MWWWWWVQVGIYQSIGLCTQALRQLCFVKVFKNDLLKAALQTCVVGKELVVHIVLALQSLSSTLKSTVDEVDLLFKAV